MELSSLDYAPLALALTHVVLGILVLAVAKLLKQLFSSYSIDQELTTADNPAFGLALAGYYLATVIVYIGAASIAPLPLDRGTAGVLSALGQDLAWAVGGVLALNGSRALLDRALVKGSRGLFEITKHRNVAAGMLEAMGSVASGLVLAAAIHQPGGTIGTVLALLIISQAAFIVIARAYQKWAGYDVAAEVRNGNLAAGVAFGLTVVAIAILMLKATSGEFAGWSTTLTFFAFDVIAGMILLLVLRWLVDLLLLPNARIAEEICRDRNVNVGLIEGVLAVGISAIILFLF